jgi:hypothetical protein
MKLKLKYLDLQKLIRIFETPSTLTEEDFNPTIGDNDFCKVESVEKASGKFLLLMLMLFQQVED